MKKSTEEIRAEFTATVKGPGKFEGEEPHVPYFWDMGMEGGADEEENEIGLGGDPKPVWVFKITSADRIIFPELSGRVQVRLVETHDGFVSELEQYPEGGQPSVQDSQNMKRENPNCDGSGPHATDQTVKRMAHGSSGGASILCQVCWAGEIAFRASRGREPNQDPKDWLLPSWEDAEIYFQDHETVDETDRQKAEKHQSDIKMMADGKGGSISKLDFLRANPYAWPGSYTHVALMGDGETICHACVVGESEIFEGKNPPADGNDLSWQFVDYYVHWEGPPILCANCNRVLESEYGDPDDDDENGKAENLIYPPRVFQFQPGKNDPAVEVDYDCYLETCQNKKVGDSLCHFVAPPGMGKIVYKITRIDETGVYGIVLESESTARISDDWNRPKAAGLKKGTPKWDTSLAERQIENWQTLVEKSEAENRDLENRLETSEAENENLRTDLEPMKIFLVYQAGIANVFQVDSFNLSDYGRDAKRIAQGGFETCSSIAHGMGLAGARVRTAACNRAGEIQSELWIDNLNDIPFRDQLIILNMAGGNHVDGTPVFDDPGPDAKTISVIVRKFDPTGPRVNETLIADRVYNLYRHTEGFNKRILRKGSDVQTADEIKIGQDYVRVEKIFTSDPSGPDSISDPTTDSLDDPNSKGV